jgi:hypothetical protein
MKITIELYDLDAQLRTLRETIDLLKDREKHDADHDAGVCADELQTVQATIETMRKVVQVVRSEGAGA